MGKKARKADNKIETEVKKATRWVDRHKFLLFLIIVLIILIIVAFGTQIYLYLNFLLGNDIVVKLDVDQKHLSLIKGEEAEINFEAKVRTNPFCSAVCSSSFEDISQGSIIESDSFELRPGLGIEKTFKITVDKFGKGLDLYRFNMECHSVSTVLCHTDEIPTERNILITVEYNPTEKETELKEELKKELNSMADRLNNLISSQRIVDENLDLLDVKVNVDTTILKSSQLKSKLNSMINSLKELDKLWIDQNIFEIEKRRYLINSSLIEKEGEFSELNQSFSSIVRRYNNLIDLLHNSSNTLTELTEIYMADSSLAIEINKKITEFNNAVWSFNIRSYISNKEDSINELTDNVINLSSYVKTNIDQQVIDLQKKLEQSYLDLCNNTGKCLNYSYDTQKDLNETCQDINDFIFFANGNRSYIDRCSKLNTSFIDIGVVSVSKVIINETDNQKLNISFEEPVPKCCIYGSCNDCCITDECNDINYPIIFIHGHAFNKDTSAEYSLDGFNKIQKKLEEDGYLSAGAISLYTTTEAPQGIWGLPNVPMSIKVSYYLDVFHEPENYVVVQTKSENIDTYSIRLKELVDTVKYITGKNKVIIIAHSMGGLVTRRYVQIFGEKDIDKIVLIGTPNKGVEGNTADYCPWIGEQLECRDMNKNSLFMNKLSRAGLPSIPVYNIIGTGCLMDKKQGDGIVLQENADLKDVNNIIIKGACSGLELLHIDMLDTDKYPVVYENIKKALSS